MQQSMISKWAITPLRLDPDASKICTIILPLEKYTPTVLTLEMAGSPEKQIVEAN
jgi:hypothetical protein